ncbi:MAG: NYN domain-containing protein [Vicinamibacteria bacterium]
MFIVDGYNAVRRIPQLASAEKKAGLEAGRRALASAIVASGVLRRDRVIVVFDAASDTAPSEPSPHPMLSIRFSNPPRDADAAILDLLSKAGASASKSVTVVTADRELAWEARRLGAQVVSPEDWALFRTKPKPRRRSSPGPATEKPEASARDVDYWLAVFGDRRDRGDRKDEDE